MRVPVVPSILLLVLTAALALRLWGIGFGLPLTAAHPDESRVNFEGVSVLAGNLRPGFFNYPSLFMYALGAVDAVYCGASVMRGTYGSVSDCAASWRTNWEPFFLGARLLSAIAGTFTVWLVYALGRRLFDPTTGVLAAAFLAVAFLHVRDSHFGVTDVAMTMLLVAAVVLLVKAVASPALLRFAAAGFVAGLAASTKYNAVLLIVPAAVSLGLLWWEGRRLASVLRDGATWGIAIACGFLAGTPYALIEPTRFWTDATAEAAHLQLGHAVNLGVGWKYHFLVTLWHGLTWPLFAAALVGAIWMAVRDRRSALLLLAFPVVYYAVAGRGYTVFARYMIPIVPFLCVTAAYFVSRTARLAIGVRPGLSLPVASSVFAIALAAPSAVKAVQLDRLLSRTDSRVLAADWVAQNVPEGSSVFVTGSHYGRPDVGRRHRPPFYSLVDLGSAGFQTRSGQSIDRPDAIVIQESPLSGYSSVPQIVTDVLPEYRLEQAFRAIDMRAPHVFDQQDAWFVPLAGFDGVGRPGPNLHVYRRVR